MTFRKNYSVIIYKNNKFYKKQIMEKRNNYVAYNWENVESGSYSFIIEEIDENRNVTEKIVTYNHTAPFAKTFDAFVEKNDKANPKPITGFQQGVDILVTYFPEKEIFKLEKQKFYKLKIDLKEYKIDTFSKIEIAGSFNFWKITNEPLKQIDKHTYEATFSLPDSVYEYKIIVDGVWYPEGKNESFVVGEIGDLYPKGELNTGKFSFDAIDKNIKSKAIVHDNKKLKYFNKISDKEYYFSLRTQKNDVKKVYLNLVINKKYSYEMIYEMEKYSDIEKGFDYFDVEINFNEKINELSYYFKLVDGKSKAYFNGKDFSNEKVKRLTLNLENNNINVFEVPDWAKEAVWYNIFPDRFYNGNQYNDPIFNEFGPEDFVQNELHEKKFIEEYKWSKSKQLKGKFDRNRWTSDFSIKTDWEKTAEDQVDYSVKYARMYGGDLQGIKEKIPYLKELGITAIWLNPVFFSYQNHKYGTNDFRHISPDLGTIKMSGNTYDINISDDNKYGNKSYLDILGINALNTSELELLEVKVNGANKGKNGYGETEDPSTWIWTESDLIMVDLIKELHKNEIRVIFDGVFNHSSDRHWSFNMILSDGEESKYKDWYKFTDFENHIKVTDEMSDEEVFKIMMENKENLKYNSWAGFKTLPEFNSFNEQFKEYIFNITRKWMYGPDGIVGDDWTKNDGIDGWRLDVPNCLENQIFWEEWRTVVKETNKDSYITAEFWGNASDDINSGKKFDTVMNYEWLKTVIGFFINQTKNGGDTYKLTPQDFLNELKEKRKWYPKQSLQSSQNLNGSHDTDRLYSRIVNDLIGRNLEEGKQLEKGYNGIRPDLASNYHTNTSLDWVNMEIKPKDILKLISIFQMTYIGAPMLFYGDEVGMWGATDPYCRKPMIWNEFLYDDEQNPSVLNKNEKYEQQVDNDLFSWYKKVIKIRKENDVLVYGNFKEIFVDNERELLAYERYYNDGQSIIIIINNSFQSQKDVEIFIDKYNVVYLDLLTSNFVKSSNNGYLNLNLKPKSGVILKKINKLK